MSATTTDNAGAKILVTGGAGFIGSAVCRHLVSDLAHSVVIVDALTYAANRDSLASISESPLYAFEHADIRDAAAMAAILRKHQPDAIMHLAAESHVDRSITGSAVFLQTNVMGTATLLEAARSYLDGLAGARREAFRMLHVSTDEVFGSLGPEGKFTEDTAYAPSSPYSASKAASDHLVTAWTRTYGMPCVTINCSNNYGPFHFPEKLIPLMILNAVHGKPLPVYGDGSNIRDWLYVEDHARALAIVLFRGKVGGRYNVGGNNERTNLQVVRSICDLLDELAPKDRAHDELITFVEDRPGHDLRYAVDSGKIERELGWQARESFETGLRKTVEWYLANEAWWRPLREARYAGERLGIVTARRAG